MSYEIIYISSAKWKKFICNAIIDWANNTNKKQPTNISIAILHHK